MKFGLKVIQEDKWSIMKETVSESGNKEEINRIESKWKQ